MTSLKTVLITGCSLGGIGDALAREFHARGHKVFATARSKAKMAELEALGIATLEVDVTSLESINAAVAAVKAATQGAGGGGGRLDILINNAGATHIMPLVDCDMADVKRVLETNIFGVFAVTHAFLPLLIAGAAGGSTKKGRGTSVVANIGSINTTFNPPYQAAYNASKAALAGFGETLRVELLPFGVHVVTVITGAIKTRLFDNSDAAASTGSCLPEGSLYAPLKDRIESKDFLANTKWTPAADYARQLASDLLKDKPKPVLWRGANSTIAWLIRTFGWAGMLDGPMVKGLGLDKLKPPVKLD